MIYLTLFLEFFKIGLFSIGGGLATVPFLSELGTKYGWFTQKELVDMIAISESTPGPIGINMATYVGFKTAGICGAVVATLSEVMPAIIIITIIAKAITKYKDNPFFTKVMRYVRPCTLALMSAAFLKLFFESVILPAQINYDTPLAPLLDLRLIGIFIGMLILKLKTKFHPLVYIALSALLGIILF